MTDVLTAGNSGVEVSSAINQHYWNNKEAWIQGQKPITLSQVRKHTPMAANALGQVFAMVDGKSGSEIMEYKLQPDRKAFKEIGQVMRDV